jgi:hypothetical protein
MSFGTPDIPNTSPVMALVVAILALVGVIANATVTYVINHRRMRSARELQSDKHAHESAVAIDDRAASERLELYREAHERSLKELEERLRHEFSRERLREMLNEENWKRVHAEVLSLGKTGHLMLDEFRGLAAKGHEYDDETLFEAFSRAVKHHQEFKVNLKGLRSQIGQEAYDRLYDIQRYLIVVLLDVARTKSERLSKVAVMSEHLDGIREKEQAFIHWLELYVKPDFVDVVDEVSIDVASDAPADVEP